MIKQMINLNPAERPTFDNLLHSSRGTVFPESFYSFLHNYVSSINELSSNFTSNMPSTPMQPTTPSTATRPTPIATTNAGTATTDTNSDTLPSDSDRRIERLWADYESVAPYLDEEAVQQSVMDVKIDYTQLPLISKPFQDVLPVELHIPNRDSKLSSPTDGRRLAALQGKSITFV